MKVAITGGAGNLGMKLAVALADAEWCKETLLLDRMAPVGALPHKARHVPCDLLDAQDTRWHTALALADAVVELGTVNTNPNCSWDDAAANLTITANVLARLGERPGRLVYASTSHVMGGYRVRDPAPGSLMPETPPRPGTSTRVGASLFGQKFRTNPAYGSAKLMAENLVRSATLNSDGRLTSVALRIGWVARGDNLAVDIELPRWRGDAAYRRWFRNLWLSNRDYTGIALAALTADASGWPEPAVVVNAMSANAGMPWSLEATERLIGYRPVDDVWAELARTRTP